MSNDSFITVRFGFFLVIADAITVQGIGYALIGVWETLLFGTVASVMVKLKRNAQGGGDPKELSSHLRISTHYYDILIDTLLLVSYILLMYVGVENELCTNCPPGTPLYWLMHALNWIFIVITGLSLIAGALNIAETCSTLPQGWKTKFQVKSVF